MLRESSNKVKSSLSISKNDLEILKRTLSDINNKNKIQAPVYVVNNIQVDNNVPIGDEKGTKYFADFVTSTGDKLPIFAKAPTIIPASNGGGTYAITHVTSTSFRISLLEYIGLENPGNVSTNTIVTIIIIQNP